MGQRLHLDPARVVNVVGLFANTSAASLPIALAAAQRAGRLHHGDRVLLAAFGAGLVWGGVVVTWGAPAYPGRVAIWLSQGSRTPRPSACSVPAFTAASPAMRGDHEQPAAVGGPGQRPGAYGFLVQPDRDLLIRSGDQVE